MNRTARSAGSLAFVGLAALSLITLSALAQDTGRMNGRGMMRGGMQATRPMMMRTRMLMTMHVNPFDPDAVLSLKDQLKLTDEQVQRLRDIAGAAREQTRAVLTDDQKAQVQSLENTPDTGMQMHRELMQRMHRGGNTGAGSESGAASDSDVQCPMVQMMQRMQGMHGGMGMHGMHGQGRQSGENQNGGSGKP